MNLLLVDDEVITINTLKVVIPWKDLGITQLFTASNIVDAKEILQTKSVQIIITDIEMPNGSGLDLISWMQTHSPNVIKILLTCHSKFDYASFALKHGVIDYLLKPIDLEAVKNVVCRAIEKSREASSLRLYIHRKQYNDLLVSEDFWRNFATGLYHDHDYDYIALTAKQQSIHFNPKRCFIPVLFSVDEAQQENQKKLDGTFSFSIKNILNEVVLEYQKDPPAIMLSPSFYLTLIDLTDHLSCEELGKRCRRVSSFVTMYYDMKLDFFIGTKTPVFQIHASVQILFKDAEQKKSRSIEIPSSLSIAAKVEEIIRQNLNQPITCEEIARQVFLNPEYLSRLFHKKTGKKLSNYIIELKMKEAKKLLKTTDKSVSTISMELGYGNFSHFSKCFRKVCGVSPQEYRETILSDL